MHQIRALQHVALQTGRATERKLQASPYFFPGTRDAGQHGNGSRRHASALRPLHSIIQADRGRALRRIFAGELLNVGGGDARPLRHEVRRVIFDLLFQLLKSRGVLRNVVGVVQAFGNDDVHHPQGQR